MATVTGLTAERMEEMEAATIIDGDVVGDNLILTTRGGTPINAGSVRGPQGVPGAAHIIVTSTTRPTLTAPDAGKSIYETDTKLVRVWTGTKWQVQEKIIATSTTRPTMTTDDEGVRLYETDTNLEFLWNGTAWVFSSFNSTFVNAAERASLLPSPPEGTLSFLLDAHSFEIYDEGKWSKPWRMPWGLVARIISSSASSIDTYGYPNVSNVTGLSMTVPFVYGRIYKYTIQGVVDANQEGTIPAWFVTKNDNTVINNDAFKSKGHIIGVNNQETVHSVSFEDALSTVSEIRKVRLKNDGDGAARWVSSTQYRSMFIVEDIGAWI